MGDYRSKSCRDGGMMQIERYNDNGGKKDYEGPTSMHDLRSYSTSHASTVHPSSSSSSNNKMKKEKNSGQIGRSWSQNDPELQRKKRVASYKVYNPPHVGPDRNNYGKSKS